MLTADNVFEWAPCEVLDEVLRSGTLPSEVYPGETEDIYVFTDRAAVHDRSVGEVLWGQWDGVVVLLDNDAALEVL